MNRPNLAMLMIDSDVLLTTTIRDLCGRLHSTNLVPFECPIVVVEVSHEHPNEPPTFMLCGFVAFGRNWPVVCV